MSKRAALHLALAVLWAALSAPAAPAQTPARARPKLRDFGSSLKRMRWDEARKAAVETARAERGAKGADDEEVVRVETDLVVCDVLVLDAEGRAVKGLSRDDFVVTEREQPQEVGTFALGDGNAVARTIVLIIDYSGSQYPFIKTSVAAAKTLVDQLGARDQMAIVTDDVELLADFTADKAKLKSKLDSLERRLAEGSGFLGLGGRRFGRSAQYSALMATLREAFVGEDLRPIIIFQTDGDEVYRLRDPIVGLDFPPLSADETEEERRERIQRAVKFRAQQAREFSLSDVYAAAERSRATVYTVIPGRRLIGLKPEEQVEQFKAQRAQQAAAWLSPKDYERIAERWKKMPDETVRYLTGEMYKVQMALGALSKVTGGWVDFLETPEQAAGIYARILSDINQRYVIGYYPADKTRDGRRREVSVAVRGHPEYLVLGRKSYYAPGPEE